MQKMNKIRNAANAFYLLNYIGNKTSFEYIERFKLDWNLFMGDLSDDAKEKFFLYVPSGS